MLRWLPSTGPNGSWLTDVAKAVSAKGLRASKQYVHQSLYPAEPKRLFTTRTLSYKAVWTELARIVEHRLDDQPLLAEYARVLEQLDQGNSVWVRNMKTCRLDMLRHKIETAGMQVTVYTQTNKVPYDYLMVPQPVSKDVKTLEGTGAMVMDSSRVEDVLEKLKSENSSLELVQFQRSNVDFHFPGHPVERLGRHHYRVDLVKVPA